MRNRLNYRWYILRYFCEAAYTLVIFFITFYASKLFALIERGYEAVGGEYIFTLMVTYASFKLINYIFDELGEMLNEYYEQEERRRIAERRNRRRNIRESTRECEEETESLIS